MEDITQDEFLEIMQELQIKQHKESLSVLRTISENLKAKDNPELSALINKNTEAVSSFLKKLQEISKPEIKFSQTETVQSISAMAKQIDANLTELKQLISAEKTWTFKVDRHYGRIDKITATGIIK